MLNSKSKQPRRLNTEDFLPKEGQLPKFLPFFAEEPGANSISRSDAQALVERARANNIELKEALQGLHFYNVKKRIQGEADFITWSSGETSTAVMDEKLRALAENHRLIAWLREALNTLTIMNNAVTELMSAEYLKLVKEWSDEDINELLDPEDEDSSSTSYVREYLETLSVEELSDYLSVEAEASVYGKALAQQGEVNEIYTQYLRAVSHPTVFDKPNAGNFNESLVVTTYDLTVPKEEMTEAYDAIMNRYLELQKQVKAHQARMADWTEQRKMEVAQENKERILRQKAIEAELSVWKSQQYKKFASLLIVIPESLQDAVEKLKS